MAYDLSDKLVVAISSRALFDLEHENQILRTMELKHIHVIKLSMRILSYQRGQLFR